jgi:hypothetical protein
MTSETVFKRGDSLQITFSSLDDETVVIEIWTDGQMDWDSWNWLRSVHDRYIAAVGVDSPE